MKKFLIALLVLTIICGAAFGVYKFIDNKKANNPVITYYANSKENPFKKDTLKKDESYAIPSDKPVLKGYNFAGWSENDDNVVDWESGEKVADKNTSWYAVWEKEVVTEKTVDTDYKLEFFAGKGQLLADKNEYNGICKTTTTTTTKNHYNYDLSSEPLIFPAVEEEVITNNLVFDKDSLPKATYLDSEFEGWSYNDSCNITDLDVFANITLPNNFGFTESKKLYAMYSFNEIIKFDINGGKGSLPENLSYKRYVNYNNDKFSLDECRAPKNNLIKTNFIANGWNTRADGQGEHFDFNDKIAKEKGYTLYAEWKESTSKTTIICGSASDPYEQNKTFNSIDLVTPKKYYKKDAGAGHYSEFQTLKLYIKVDDNPFSETDKFTHQQLKNGQTISLGTVFIILTESNDETYISISLTGDVKNSKNSYEITLDFSR